MLRADLEDTTEDAILGGKIRLRQPVHGYRAGLDAIFLAAGVDSGDRLMEAGCGVGAALIAVAQRLPRAHLTGVERHRQHADMARENVCLNQLQDRVSILDGDALEANVGVFDGVFVNPPYYEEGQGNAPAAAKAHAYQTSVPIDRWVGVLSNRLRGGGFLTMIHRADRLAEILAALEGRLGGALIFPLRARGGSPASRVVVRARKGSRAPLTLMEGMTLHSADGAFTPEAQAILTGEACLRWT